MPPRCVRSPTDRSPAGCVAPGNVDAGEIVAWAMAMAVPSFAPASLRAALPEHQKASEAANHDDGAPRRPDRSASGFLVSASTDAAGGFRKLVLLQLVAFLGFHTLKVSHSAICAPAWSGIGLGVWHAPSLSTLAREGPSAPLQCRRETRSFRGAGSVRRPVSPRPRHCPSAARHRSRVRARRCSTSTVCSATAPSARAGRAPT